MKRNFLLSFFTTFLLCFISVAYAAFNSELTITGEGLVQKDTTPPTCGAWYLRDSSLTIQEAYNQNKFINPGLNTTWTDQNEKLFIECTDNMPGAYGCINVTEITDNNNNKRYFKEVKEYTTSIKSDGAVTVTLQDAYLNERTCTLPAGGSNPYIDKVAPEITINRTAANKFSYIAEDNFEVLGYMVTTTPTEPALDDPNWLTEPEEVTIDNTEAKTYYVWAKDGINITSQTIDTYLLTKSEGTGTTLTLKYENAAGAELSTGYVLDGTNLYVDASANQGYSNLTVTKNNASINVPSTQTINSATTIASSAQISQVTVTFDPNGGLVDPLSKTVNIGSTYGTLPTPTKTGYTFNGWRGKNMLKIDTVSSLPSDTSSINTTSRTFTPNTYVIGLAVNNFYIPSNVSSVDITDNSVTITGRSGYGVGYPMKCQPNTQYTLSYTATVNSGSNPYVSLAYYESDGTFITWVSGNLYNSTGYNEKTVTTPSDAYYIVPIFAQNNGTANITYSDIQLEEGSTATTYEPYYITENTIVKNQNDHTITAEWTINTYTVNYNANGGVGTMPSQIITYNSSVTLIKNTFARDNYTFIGWNTEPDGSGTAYLDEAPAGTMTEVNNDIITLYAQWKQRAIFEKGGDFRNHITDLINGSQFDNKLVSFTKGEPVMTLSEDYTIINVAAVNSALPIYVYYDSVLDDGHVYWWSEDDTPYLNPDSSAMFNFFTCLNTLDVSQFDTSLVTNMTGMFIYVGSSSGLTSLDVSNFDTSNVVSMADMFQGTALESLDLSSFDTSNVTDMSSMFYNSTLTNIDVSNFDTSNVTNMSFMFYSTALESLDLSSFDTSNVTDMSGMFGYNENLNTLDISSFDMRKVTNTSSIFAEMYSLAYINTPSYNSNASISTLPATFLDDNNNEYTTLNSAPTTTWLHIGDLITVTFNANGGTVSPSTKGVIFYSMYGTLPTPEKEGYEFTGWKLLPDDYFAVEYISSSGTQWIDTGVTPNQDTRIEFNFISLEVTGDVILGYYAGNDSTDYRLFNANSNLYFDQISERINTTNGTSCAVGANYNLEIGNYYVKNLNNNSNIITGTKNNSFTGVDTIKINKGNTSNAKTRIYSLKIYDGTTIIRDYIPVVKYSTWEPGLYDIVNGVFYGNDGTNDFGFGNFDYNHNYINEDNYVSVSHDHTLYADWSTPLTVTFDAQGGTVSPSSKQVYSNKIFDYIINVDQFNYGELPTPVREGYVFKGWMSKNMFNPYELRQYNYIELDGTNNQILYSVDPTSDDRTWDPSNVDFAVPLDPGTYTLTFNMETQSTNNDAGYILYKADPGSGVTVVSQGTLKNLSTQTTTFTITDDGTQIGLMFKLYDGTAKVQLERGNTSSAWSPYIFGDPQYVTSTTEVDAIYDHVLVADWEAAQEEYEYGYTGDYQLFVAPYTGYYKVELWGAQGGNYSTNPGGKGAYTSGYVQLNKGEKLYVYIGGQGGNKKAGYNGGAIGGTGTDGTYTGGGGSTDVRYFLNEPTTDDLYWRDDKGLKSRIMVAAGGAGTGYYYSNVITGGSGGALTGYSGTAAGTGSHTVATGGTQTSGGKRINDGSSISGFGYASSTGSYGTGGGGGYYGGGSGGSTSNYVSAGAGGSSYISGYEGCNSVANTNYVGGITHTYSPTHFSGKVFVDPVMIAGNASMPTTSGGTETGHTGNGYAIITHLPDITVTFDAQGGTVSPSTKSVSTNTPYGSLPIPEKEGSAFVGWTLEEPELPSGYEKLEYIESSGTQWIDTGVTPSKDIKMQYNFRPLAIGSSGQIFLGHKYSSSNIFGIAFYSSNRFRAYELYNKNAYTSTNYVNTSTDYNLEIGNLYIKDLDTGTNVATGTTQTSAATGSTILINKSGSSTFASVRTYSLKIYNGSTLVRDYIPTKRTADGKVGLYDKVNGVFYIDSAGGNFIPGPSAWSSSSSDIVTNKTIVTDTIDHTLYAIWNTPLTVTFDPNGGSVTPTTKVLAYGGKYGNLPIPVKTGYTFNGWVDSDALPDGYTELEYIESTGTQYIDTNYFASINTEIEFETMCTDTRSVTTNTYTQITGARDTYHSSSAIQVAYNTYSDYIAIDYGTNGMASYQGNNLSKNTKINVRIANNDIRINNNIQTQAGSFSGTSPYSLWIFDDNNAGSSENTYYGRLYSYKIYEAGIIKRNFIPCINETTGKAGLYDKVNDVFYGNSGTGDFVAGPYKYVSSKDKVTKTTNFTLVADYTKTQYTINYTSNVGTVSGNPASYTIDTATFTLTNPTKTGYVFAGWSGTDLVGDDNLTVTIPQGSLGERSYVAHFVSPTIAGIDYTGSMYQYIAPQTGVYKIELWGAQGGSYSSSPLGGKGSYTSGMISLTKGEILYVYVGNQPSVANTANYSAGGWNGGGNSGYNSSTDYSRGGGGATDVRMTRASITATLWNSAGSLRSRIMVAAGGGGAVKSGSNYSLAGAPGGTLNGNNGVSTYNATTPTGGTQTSYGTGKHTESDRIAGFGFGGGQQTVGTNTGWGGGGGSGYYGGALGYGFPGASGSSYISGYLGSVAVTSSGSSTPRKDSNNTTCTNSSALNDITCSYHYSNKIFTNPVMIGGNASMPSPSGGTETGHGGNGYAKITLSSTFTLNYNNNGGSGCTSKEVSSVDPVGTLCTPTRSGYVFVGWNTDPNGAGTTITENSVVQVDTIYAMWTSNKHTITVTPSTNITSCSMTGCTSGQSCTYGTQYTITCNKKANTTASSYTYTNGENFGSYRYKVTTTYGTPSGFTCSGTTCTLTDTVGTVDKTYTVTSTATSGKAGCQHRESNIKSFSYSNFKGCFSTGSGSGCDVTSSSWRTNGSYCAWNGYTGNGPDIPVYDNGGTGNQNAVVFKVNVTGGYASVFVQTNDPQLLRYQYQFDYSYTLYEGSSGSSNSSAAGRLNGSGASYSIANSFYSSLRWVSSSCP